MPAASIAFHGMAEKSAAYAELAGEQMAAQRMAACEESDAKGGGSRSVENFRAKAPDLMSEIPQPSLTMFRCVDLGATRMQTIATVHYSFLSFNENNSIPLLRVQQSGKIKVE